MTTHELRGTCPRSVTMLFAGAGTNRTAGVGLRMVATSVAPLGVAERAWITGCGVLAKVDSER